MACLTLVVTFGCDKPSPAGKSQSGGTAPRSSPAPKPPAAGEVVLTFPYGSEKKLWIDEVTGTFNAAQQKVKSGKSIRVEATAMGSGELVDDTLEGRVQAHLLSPASKAFITLANSKSQAKSGGPLVGETRDLLVSPVVIAMWKPMAEALGWPDKPVGWAEIAAITKDPQGWGSKGNPQWGRFKFGHTHPEYSNSGLISVIALAYAGAGKTQDLTMEDLASPAVAKELADIQKSIVHYGESTGFFGRKLFSSGPEYLSAAVLYENMVIESYDTTKYKTAFPIVAIYPKEGTFWSEHPCGVVERPWVTAEHREAARVYMDYLLGKAQQEKALAYGFRPADVSIPIGAPLDAAHGVNPKEPQTTLAVPEAGVIAGTIDLWKKHKKHANIVLVLDVSGSMKGERIENARAGAGELVKLLSDEDTFSFVTFNERVTWNFKNLKMKDGREKALKSVSSVIEGGGTALYDATGAAFDHLMAAGDTEAITAVVVLTDGEDNKSKVKLDDLVTRITSDAETRNVRVFTIGYGEEASKKVLEKIAGSTQAKFYKGDPKNIRQVFKEIATFF